MNAKTPLNRYVLDSYAILAILENQPGADRVSEVIASPDAAIFMSVVNLGEVLYIVERRRSRQAAADVAQAIIATEEIRLVDATFERAQITAGFKALGGLSYADCFAVALAKEVSGTILTGDPEFTKAGAGIEIEWLK